MAICKFCNQEMMTGDGCTVAYDAQKRRMRIRFGEEHWTERSPALDGPCHDCEVSAGDYHHPGCDMEKCPACGEQRLLCPCHPSPAWTCPRCQADLEAVGVAEVRTGVMTWTIWQQRLGRWDIGEEDTNDGDTWHLECRACDEPLPDELGGAFWDAMEKSWAGL